MLTDLFVGAAEDIPRIVSEGAGGSRLCVEAKGVDQVTLASLALLLLGRKPEEQPRIHATVRVVGSSRGRSLAGPRAGRACVAARRGFGS